jgi:hypothetical protein
MQDQSHPATKQDAPDPARVYERAKPEKEAGMGRLDNNKATPTDAPDRMEKAVDNAQPPKGVAAEDVVDQRATGREPDHSMLEEEPMDTDQAPQDIHSPRHKRHPRTEGKGGLD